MINFSLWSYIISLVAIIAYIFFLVLLVDFSFKKKIVLCLLTLVCAVLGQYNILLVIVSVFLTISLLKYKDWSRQQDLFMKDITSVLWATFSYCTILFFTKVTLNFWLSSLTTDVSGTTALVSLYFTMIYGALFYFLTKDFFLRLEPSKFAQKIYIVQLSILILLICLIYEIFLDSRTFGKITGVLTIFILFQFLTSAYFSYIQLKKTKEKESNARLRQELELMNLYTQEIEKNYQALRNFKHDYQNLLLGLKNSNQINRNYLEKISDFSENYFESVASEYGQLSQIKVVSLKSFLITKLYQAKQADLNLKLEVVGEVPNLEKEEVNLIRALGILIDNAIEAAIESEDKFIFISISDLDRKLEFCIENSFADKLKIEQYLKSGKSSKGKNRGIGLANLEELIDENPEFKVDRYTEGQKFITILSVG